MPAPDTVVVDCHAFGLYPYVGCNELMRHLFPDIRRDRPDLVREFVRSLVTLAPDTHAGVLDALPDLADIVGEPGGIPFASGLRDEGLHPLDRTTWLAHGVVSLILRWRSALTGAPVLKLVFTNLATADPLQVEFVDILARRADPGLLEVIRDGGERSPAVSLSPENHWAQAEELMAGKRRSLDLSSVLYHLKRSTAPTEVTLSALTGAAEHYLAVGFYVVALHIARIAARYGPPHDAPTERTLSTVVAFALLLLGRLDEAEAFCAERVSTSDDPLTRMTCSYARAVLRARFRPADQRDFRAAAEHMELAIGYVDTASPGPCEVGNRIFLDKNFRALLAMRARRPDEAMRLQAEGLADIRRLCPERYQAEGPIFLQNQARVHTALKQADLAVASYTEAIALEPLCAEMHFERGNAHRACGDERAALADYRSASQAGPARPEMHFNAGLAAAALGDHDEALAGYSLALDLDPGYAFARLNRATMHYRAGRLSEAGLDADTGLRTNPHHPDLLCIRGLVRYASGDLDAALADFSEALVHDPSHVAALKNRSCTLFAMGNVTRALRDADRCVTVRPDGAAFLNRGYLHQSSGSWQRALADYRQAAAYGDIDHAELARRRSICVRGLIDDAPLARSRNA
jgi:tetratricopeptide (TPR) repeat protein